MFGKKRYVDFVLSPDPQNNKPPEKEDKDIQIDISQKIALGPAATEQDEMNYSSGSMIGSKTSYYNIAQGIGTQQSMQQNSQNTTQTNNENEIFVPFIPDGVVGDSSTPQNYSSNDSNSDVIKLQRKIEELTDKIYLLERKIERLEEKSY